MKQHRDVKKFSHYPQILELVKSCQTWKEFTYECTPIYDYANQRGWGYSLKVDSGIRHRFYYKWMTDQQLIELGSDYSSLTELTKGNGALQAELYKRKLTRQLPYQFKGEGNKRLYTYEICKEAVSQVSSRQELYETNKPCWTAIYRHGWKDYLMIAIIYTLLQMCFIFGTRLSIVIYGRLDCQVIEKPLAE